MIGPVSSKVSVLSGEYKAVQKVPGKVSALGNLSHESQNCLSKMKNKSLNELKEILNREIKIANNDKLLRSLPDKGLKIKNRVKDLQAVIDDKVKEIDKTIDLLGSLSIKDEKIDVEALEWNSVSTLDSSQKETLVALACKERPTLKEVDEYYQELSQKIDSKVQKNRFIPVNTVKLTNLKKQATPSEKFMPLPSHSNSKSIILPLTESIRLQIKKAEEFRAIRLKHTQEKLSLSSTPAVDLLEIKDSLQYRDNVDNDSEEDDDDQEEEETYED